jgi:hypothetical protein
VIDQRDKNGRIIKATGRATGSKNKRPNIHAVLPPNAIAELYTKIYEAALTGDMMAARLLLDRLDPAPKGRPVELPGVPLPIDGLPAAQEAGRKVVEAMVAGELSPAEAAETIGVITQQITTVEARDWSRLLEQLQVRSRG